MFKTLKVVTSTYVDYGPHRLSHEEQASMLMRAISEKSRLMRVGFRTGTHRKLEWPRKTFFITVKRMHLTRETNASAKHCSIL
jgi:hypothetical protein